VKIRLTNYHVVVIQLFNLPQYYRDAHSLDDGHGVTISSFVGHDSHPPVIHEGSPQLERKPHCCPPEELQFFVSIFLRHDD
jgi:hypothetical protein